MPDQRVVAPPPSQQRWGGYIPYQGSQEYGYGGNPIGIGVGLQEADGQEIDLGPQFPLATDAAQLVSRITDEAEKAAFTGWLEAHLKGAE